MTNNFLYNNIENPLNDAGVIKEIIGAYATPSFSNALLKTNSSSSEVISNEIEVDKLYAKLFNTWKHSILTLKPEQIKTAIARGIYDKSIYKLYDLLRETPNVTTMQETIKIFTKDYSDLELVDAINKYKWDSSSNFKETIINARTVYAKKFPGLDPEHELYINSANYDLHKLANLFIDKCTEMDLPYYFKIAEHDNCDNKMTIYSDSENLSKIIEILSQIEKEYPQIIKRCGEPPIISGQITKWLGYGRASVSSNGKLEYFPKRIKTIEKSLDQELRAWYKENKDQLTIKDRNNNSVSLIEYLSLQICKDEIIKMINCLPKTDNEKSYNLKKYGYTEEMLENSENKKKIYSIILKEMTKIIDDYSNGRPLTKGIIIKFSNGKEYTISKLRIVDEIKKSIKMVDSVDESFARKVKSRIIENSKQEGINPNKYCFDQKKKKPTTTNKKAVLLQQLESTKKLAQQFGCQYPREPRENETIEAYGMYLALYCTKILKPVMDGKNYSTTNDSNRTSNQNQMSNNNKTSHRYKTMTSEEIVESRKKLGFEATHPQETQQKNTTKVNWFTNNTYREMTPEELVESRKKLGFEKSSVRREEKTTEEAINELNHSQVCVYKSMTEEEIIASRQKIGEYIPQKQKRK